MALIFNRETQRSGQRQCKGKLFKPTLVSVSDLDLTLGMEST